MDGRMPKARDLHELINRSSSSRQYFLSLPVKTQLMLHERGEHIQTAFELRRHADYLRGIGHLLP